MTKTMTMNRRAPHPLPTRAAWLVPLVAALAGCAAGPDFQRPSAPTVAAYTADPPSAAALAAASAGARQGQQLADAPVPAGWWQEFHNKPLDRLVARALAESPTLAAAQANLRQAEHAYAAAAGATRLPQLSAQLSAQRQGTNSAAMGLPGGERTFSLGNAGLALGYDFDLAGGNRRALEALAAQTEYQSHQLAGARLTLAATVVLTAITQARLTDQIAATEKLIEVQAGQLQITRERVALGAASEAEALPLATQLDQTRAGLPLLHNQREQTRHLLAVLGGTPPAAFDVPNFQLADFVLPPTLPLRVPSALVRQRPDIQASEALLHAASAQYGAAIARRYPQLTLSASVGAQALTAAGLFGPGSLVWGVGGQLAQPLFNPGLKANVRAFNAALEAAEANYKEVVLQSLRQVADVLRTLESDALAEQSLESASRSADQGLDLVERQHRLGAASYLQLLLAQQQALQTRLGVLDVQGRRLANTVALYRAMGGGGEEASPPAPIGSRRDTAPPMRTTWADVSP